MSWLLRFIIFVTQHTIAYMLLWISDICQYFLYFIFPLFTSRKTQHDTYQNFYSEFILNFLDIIYSNGSISQLIALTFNLNL